MSGCWSKIEIVVLERKLFTFSANFTGTVGVTELESLGGCLPPARGGGVNARESSKSDQIFQIAVISKHVSKFG